jgi:hypothetical protein
MLVVGFEVEPLLTFRPVDAQVVGADVAHLELVGHRSNTFDAYPTEVLYRYQVGGVPYMGRRHHRADLEGSLSTARLRAQAYASGGWGEEAQQKESGIRADSPRTRRDAVHKKACLDGQKGPTRSAHLAPRNGDRDPIA